MESTSFSSIDCCVNEFCFLIKTTNVTTKELKRNVAKNYRLAKQSDGRCTKSIWTFIPGHNLFLVSPSTLLNNFVKVILFSLIHTIHFFIICLIAIAQHGTNYKITCVCLSFCQSVCKHSYGRNFDLILTRFCTLIRGPKSKMKFVWDINLITSSSILPQFCKNLHYGL